MNSSTYWLLKVQNKSFITNLITQRKSWILNTGVLILIIVRTNKAHNMCALIHRSDRFCRGLIIDQKRGNVLKIDRHKYVRKVFHGLDELDSERKKALYSQQLATYTESNYVNIDTLFQIVGEGHARCILFSGG